MDYIGYLNKTLVKAYEHQKKKKKKTNLTLNKLPRHHFNLSWPFSTMPQFLCRNKRINLQFLPYITGIIPPPIPGILIFGTYSFTASCKKGTALWSIQAMANGLGRSANGDWVKVLTSWVSKKPTEQLT